jgi:Cd2+/Zn2+-exporting ATPase
LAAALESRSAHPLAQAVVRAAQAKGLTLPPVGDVESVTGQGLRATVGTRQTLIGNRKLMDDARIAISTQAAEQISQLQAAGKTIMLVAVDGKLVGVLGLADTLRAEARTAMAELKKMGVRQTIMLTGDNDRVAAAIAQQVGLTDYRAELLPEDKLKIIRELTEKYGSVAMVGDGVNDAPALANATVGIAMGGAGTDVALETADVALMGDNLSKLPFAVGLGAATRTIIKQNLVIALGVIALLALSALLGLTSIGVAILFHEGSTLVVVANALRLLRYRGPVHAD